MCLAVVLCFKIYIRNIHALSYNITAHSCIIIYSLRYYTQKLMPGERESVAGDESWPIPDEKNKSKEEKKSRSSFSPFMTDRIMNHLGAITKIDAVTLDVHIT